MECKADHAVELQNAGLKKPEAEICAAARGRAAERKAGSLPKLSPAQPSEKSSDSSPLSGVSVSSCKADSPLSCRASALPKDNEKPASGLDAEPQGPAAKRHCPDGPKAALIASGQQAKKKWGFADSKKLAPSNAMQEGVVDPAGGDDGVDPADLISWPDTPLDFSLDAGEIEDMGSQQAAARLSLGKRAAEKETRGPAAKEGSQDSQSESAREGPEASEPQGTEGTSSSGAKGGKASPPGKRKVKVDWTPDLHRKFVQAVEQLGVEKAIPSRILELMGVKCLTRHNIASHLQKYRSHRRHLAAREAEAANWQQQRKAADAPLWPVNKPGSGNFSGWGPFGAPAVPAVPGAAPMGFAPGLTAAGPVPGRPVMGLPPPGVVHGMPHMGPPVPGAPAGAVSLGQPQPNAMGAPGVPAIGMPMQVWGHPTVDHAHAHMWQRPGGVYPMPPPAWFGPDGTVWHYPTPFQQAPSVDMWGNPAAPAPGFPGGGMVAGTPCFPQHMQMQPPPQRMPSGMSSSGPASGPGGSLPGLFSPAMGTASGMGAEPETPQTPAVSVSGMSTETGAVEGSQQEQEQEQGEEEEMRDMKAALESVTSVDDSFIEDALHESMFNMPEEFSLDFGTCTSDLQASSALDAAISEALANPSTPLPLGLRPPSVDGVLEELNRQGITMLPPLKGCGAHAQVLDIKAELLGDDMLSEVDNHPLSLCGDMHGESEDALNALLDP